MASAATQLTGPIPAEVLVDDVPQLDVVLTHPDDPDYAPWHVSGRSTAEWAMTRLAEAQAALEPITERHAVWRARLADLEARESAGLVQTVRFFTAELERYATSLRATGELTAKGATLRLANGRVETTEYQPRIELAAAAGPDLATWVRANWKAPAVEAVVRTPEPPPPTVLVSEVKLLVELAAWPTEVELAPCGHLVTIVEGGLDPDTGERIHPLALEIGRAIVCPAPHCTTARLVAKITETRPAIVDVDGREVPYLTVVPTKITAKVVVE